MQRRYLFVMDPIESINPFTDSTFYLMLESQSRGIENLFCTLKDLIVYDGKGFAKANTVQVNLPTKERSSFYTLGKRHTIPFVEFDAIFMRKDPPVDQKFISACLLLNCHNPKDTVIINNPRGLLIANEKLWGLCVAPELMPKTVVSSSIRILTEAANHLGKVVLKPLFQSGGGGILVLEKKDPNLRSALEILTENGQKPAILQQYLNGAKQGDKRVILLGGKPIGALLRVPKETDHRANLHIGSTAQKAPITSQDEKIANILAPKLLELGLYFVGIDVIEDKVTEINVTSPTGLQEIDRLEKRLGKDKLNVQILSYIDRLLMKR